MAERQRPDYGSFDPYSMGGNYIHSSIYNFNSIYSLHIEDRLKTELKKVGKEMISFLDKRIALLRALRKEFEKKVSPEKPNQALKVLNKLYNKFYAAPGTLFDADLRIKEFSTYFRTNKNDPYYQSEYKYQVNNLVEAFSNYLDLRKNLKDQIKGSTLLRKADAKLLIIARQLKKFVKENNENLYEPGNYIKIMNIVRNSKNEDLTPGFINLTLKNLANQISLDGAIGYIRESSINEVVVSLLRGKETLTQNDKMSKILNIGEYNKITQRADTYITSLSVEKREYHVGFNVKSFSHGFPKISSGYVARDFSGFLKTNNKKVYNMWSYLTKNIAALKAWDSSKFKDFIGDAYAPEEVGSLILDMDKKLIQYEKLFSQIYNLAGFLDGFLEFTEKNGFNPEIIDNPNTNSSKVKVAKEYIHSVALAMQDRVFWIDQILSEIKNIFRNYLNEFIDLENSPDPKIDLKSFRSRSTSENINPFSSDESFLIQLYRDKLKARKKLMKLGKESITYAEMIGQLKNLQKYENFNINRVKKNYYYVDPYVLMGRSARRINMKEDKFI